MSKGMLEIVHFKEGIIQKTNGMASYLSSKLYKTSVVMHCCTFITFGHAYHKYEGLRLTNVPLPPHAC